MAKTVYLLRGKEKSLRRLHPWIFSGAISKVTGSPESGETVEVVDADGQWLALGAWSPISKIRVRIWSFNPSDEPGFLYFVNRLALALEWRKKYMLNDSITAYRWINGEVDGFPGLIVDRYADFLVCQFLSTAAEFWKADIVKALIQIGQPTGIYERSDSNSRKLEGYESQTGLIYGQEPPENIIISDGICRYLVDVRNGHKTGFYLDQRLNRSRVSAYAHNASVLNCFSYTGAFGISALQAGARHITNVDSSKNALEIARKNMELNGFSADACTCVEANVFDILRKSYNENQLYDMVILDPPKFADSRRQVPDACKGYKDINRLAIQALRPGGILATFSCSGAIDRDIFQQTVAFAAMDAGRPAVILEHLGQSPDHPFSTAFPEGFYLKGLIAIL